MAEPAQSEQNEERGKVDAVSILYVLGGIPVLVAFLVLFFVAVRACGIPG